MRIIAGLIALLLLGCSFHMPRIGLPRVHRITIQQGNVITQTMIDKLKPGMTKRQVAFIMGDPVLKSTFSPERWDYIYSIQIPNVGTTKRRATLYFDGDLLAYFTGDYAPSEFSKPGPPTVEGLEEPNAPAAQRAAVEPPADPS